MMRLSTRALKFRTPSSTSTSGIVQASTVLVSICRSHRAFAAVRDLDALDSRLLISDGASVGGPGDPQRPDQRTLQLGRTVRELHERLPTLLQTPLPSDILSPQITLHLFPSTHPHLPTVSGRIAYAAALWTAPVAWGRIPLIGNVKLTILSERMVKSGGGSVKPICKLIVRWKTRGKGGHRDTSGGIYRDSKIGARDPEDKINMFLQNPRHDQALDALDKTTDEDFCGIFIFEFDEHGRILKHIIEHIERGGYEDKTTKFVNVTDWLLGKFNGATKGEEMPALAFCERQQPLRMHLPRRQP